MGIADLEGVLLRVYMAAERASASGADPADLGEVARRCGLPAEACGEAAASLRKEGIWRWGAPRRRPPRVRDASRACRTPEPGEPGCPTLDEIRDRAAAIRAESGRGLYPVEALETYRRTRDTISLFPDEPGVPGRHRHRTPQRERPREG